MGSTNKTEGYELSQFINTDTPDWLTDYNDDMFKVNNGLSELNRNKVNSESYQNFAPELASSTIQGNWDYVSQWGEYKIVDEYILFAFRVRISNMQSGGGSGNLRIATPVPASGPYCASINSLGVFQGISDLSLWADGSLVGRGASTGADMSLGVGSISSELFEVKGQLFYRYK